MTLDQGSGKELLRLEKFWQLSQDSPDKLYHIILTHMITNEKKVCQAEDGWTMTQAHLEDTLSELEDAQWAERALKEATTSSENTIQSLTMTVEEHN